MATATSNASQPGLNPMPWVFDGFAVVLLIETALVAHRQPAIKPEGEGLLIAHEQGRGRRLHPRSS